MTVAYTLRPQEGVRPYRFQPLKFTSEQKKTLTHEERQEKIDRYIESVVQGMDWKTMYHYVYESIEEDLKDSTDEQIDEMYN